MPFHLGNGEQRTQFPLLHLNRLISVFCSLCLPSLRWPSLLSFFVLKSYIMSLNAHAYFLMADQLIYYDNFPKIFWFLLLSERHKLLEEIGTDQDPSLSPTLSSLGFVRGTDSPESPRNCKPLLPFLDSGQSDVSIISPLEQRSSGKSQGQEWNKNRKSSWRGENDVKTCHTWALKLC